MISFLDSIGTLNSWLVAVGLNTVLILVAFGVPKKLLTPAGLLHAWALGVLIWGTLGWPGYCIVLFYFFVGSGITFVGMAEKEAAGIAEERSGMRGPGNLWGSALTAAVCALGILIAPPLYQTFLELGFVASFATKLSDTCATEIGKAFGQRTFLITTFQAVPRGTEGAISLEGTLAGGLGASLLAILGWIVGLIPPLGILFCVMASFIATNVESVLGATVEGKVSWLTHDVINIINTAIGALVAMGLALVWRAAFSI